MKLNENEIFSKAAHIQIFLTIDVTFPYHFKSNTPITIFPCNQVEKDSARIALFSWYFLLHFVQSSKFFGIDQSWEDLGMAQL